MGVKTAAVKLKLVMLSTTMKIGRLIIILLSTISCSSSYTLVSHKPLSEKIIGKWSREVRTNDEFGMPLKSPYKDFIIFNNDHTYSSVYEDLKGSYNLSNDTLSLFDIEKDNMKSFKIKIIENLYLDLFPISSESNESKKFNFFSGKWNWW